ncbi:hypothetical protein ACHAWF_005947 [Thalassiosira exigua]
MSRAVVISSNKIAILVGTALFAGYLIGRWSSNNDHRKVAPHEDGDVSGAFVLLVNMKFASLSHRDTFLEWMKPVCEDVAANEGGTTLSYKVAVSDKDPLRVVVMERYTDKDRGYLKVHKSGVEFQKFRERLRGMQDRGDVAIDGESYMETDLGFV